MNISFALTKAELLAGLKTCTRRRWKARTARQFREGTTHTGWSADTRVRGAERLCIIRATKDAYPERLGDMPEADLLAEGGMCETVDQFIELINGTADEVLYVARFEIVKFL